MSGYNNQIPQVQALTRYQAITEQTEEELYNFSEWVSDNWEWDEGPLPKTSDDMVVVIRDAIAKYLMQDEKSQALIKAGEQELLKKWSK